MASKSKFLILNLAANILLITGSITLGEYYITKMMGENSIVDIAFFGGSILTGLYDYFSYCGLKRVFHQATAEFDKSSLKYPKHDFYREQILDLELTKVQKPVEKHPELWKLIQRFSV